MDETKKETSAVTEVSKSAQQTLIVATTWAQGKLESNDQLSKEETILLERIIGSCTEIIIRDQN